MKTISFFLIKISLAAVIITSLLSFTETKNQDDVPWVSLFNGESLEGWSQMGGEAKYKVEDSAIVGITVHSTPNSFLTTEEEYTDFILELDYKVASSMNSGIQIRSNSFDYYKDGRVHGYHIEIDP